MTHQPYALEAVANYHCRTGEGPLYDDQKDVLYWVDIPDGELYRLDCKTGAHRKIYSGTQVGGFTLQEDGTLILFRENEIAHMDPDTGAIRSLRSGIDSNMERFNDVIADPEGRVFAGTIGMDDQRGGVYRVERDGTLTHLFYGTGCSNGMAFTGDLKTFYWTCSTRCMIFAYDYNRKTGALTNERVFAKLDQAREGIPDGHTMDTEDHLWSARWGGSCVVRYNPAGKVVDRIDLPTGNITSCIFAGPTLNTMYITSATGDEPNAPDVAGTLFRTTLPYQGRREFRSRIKV